MASKQDRLATPLVLPNNSNWDEKTGKYTTKPNVKRQNLTVVPEALKQLKEIKGHVCVVSIAGPCRQGKSYILGKVFDQGQVFPLGHLLDPETMGIWLWVVPEKFKDSTGREFTVVLLDSEGIDAVSSENSNNHKIFTLSVLLSSIMIYNSAGVPNRFDLEGLDFISKLSQRIQLQTDQSIDEQQFSKAFPYFIWLLRDVQLSLPKGCKTIKDYFLKRVLNCEAEGNSEEANKTSEIILKYFSGFDAFSLPVPTFNDEVIKNLDDEKFKSQINPKFLKEVKDFKAVLHSKLSPKKSINKGEFVTGEALAALIQLFVEALNTPGAVPNVQNAWDTFVQTKCSEVLADAVKVYEQEMTSLVEKKIPCGDNVLRSAHDNAMEKCLEMFRNETFSFSIKSVDKYLKELTDKTDSILTSWLDKNRIENLLKKTNADTGFFEKSVKLLECGAQYFKIMMDNATEAQRIRAEQQMRADIMRRISRDHEQRGALAVFNAFMSDMQRIDTQTTDLTPIVERIMEWSTQGGNSATQDRESIVEFRPPRQHSQDQPCTIL